MPGVVYSLPNHITFSQTDERRVICIGGEYFFFNKLGVLVINTPEISLPRLPLFLGDLSCLRALPPASSTHVTLSELSRIRVNKLHLDQEIQPGRKSVLLLAQSTNICNRPLNEESIAGVVNTQHEPVDSGKHLNFSKAALVIFHRTATN